MNSKNKMQLKVMNLTMNHAKTMAFTVQVE
jgi:hypothetical protein